MKQDIWGTFLTLHKNLGSLLRSKYEMKPGYQTKIEEKDKYNIHHGLQ